MKLYRKLFFGVVLIFSTTILSAQTPPNITVTVKDSVSAEAIGFATVELLNQADSSLVAGITNEDGVIVIPAQAGIAKVRVGFIGYKTHTEPITALNMSILLAEDATQLADVTVEGASRTAKIDRDVFVITKDLKAGAATSRELLGKLNGVQYNPYDQSIMVNGNSNVLILMDGIEKDQNMAKTISPDRIDRVEVIKNPVGKYAADGYTAVINIITKKDYSGFDITVNSNPLVNFITPVGNKPVFFQQNSNVNILYTYKKLNLYATYFGFTGNIKVPSTSEVHYGDLMVKTPSMDYNNPNTHGLNNYHQMSVGGDYLLKEGNTLALEVNYNTGYNNMTTTSNLNTYLNNILTGQSTSTSFSHNTFDILTSTLTYNGKWSNKSNFTADLRYRHSTPSNLSTFVQGEDINSESRNNQVENFYRINAQYTYQFTPKFSMDIGYGAIVDRYNLYQNNSVLTQNQLRNRPSVYFSYTFSDKLNMKIGAMVEIFEQNISLPASADLKQSQTGFLPYARIMYKVSDNLNFTLGYKATPGYPDVNSINTFKTQQDSLTWSVGNPNLKLSNYQVVNLNVNFLKYFNLEPFIDFDNSNNTQYLYKKDGQYFTQPVNANYKKLGFNLNFTYPITKTFYWQTWLQMCNGWFQYNDKDNNLTVQNHQFSYMFNSMFIYNIPKWDAMFAAGMQKNLTKWATLQGYNRYNNDIPMLMAQKNLFKKLLSISLIYVPPIEAGFVYYQQENMTKTSDYYSLNSYGLDLLKNLIILQINIHINQGKQVNVTKSSLGDDSNVKQKSGVGL